MRILMDFSDMGKVQGAFHYARNQVMEDIGDTENFGSNIKIVKIMKK